jgi:thermitase
MDTQGNTSALLRRLGPPAADILVHDPDGPTECLVRWGELLAPTDRVPELARRLGDRVARVDTGRLVLRTADARHCVEIAADYAESFATRPNHVHLGAPVMFGTGAEPVEAPLPPAPPAQVWDPAVTVAVLDTGLDPHPWFAGRPWLSDWGLSPEVLTGDPHADRLAGHGTFVAGVLLQHAPGVTVRHQRSLSSAGITDDHTVARALRAVRLRAAAHGSRLDIVVLTAGCRTADDRCPPVLARELAQHRGTQVVASAGNDGSTRPFWPAALPTVLAVAAADADGRRAPFANHGPWVDALAPGVDVLSSYLCRQPDPAAAPDTATRRYTAARWSGSSFAAPYRAAELARQLHESRTMSQSVAGVT